MPSDRTNEPKKKGPKLMGTQKRECIALTFDPVFLKGAKVRAKKEATREERGPQPRVAEPNLRLADSPDSCLDQFQ